MVYDARYLPSHAVDPKPADLESRYLDSPETLMTDEEVDALFDRSDGSWIANEEALQHLPLSEREAEREFRATFRKRLRFEIECCRRSRDNLTPELLAELWFDAG